MKNKTVTDELTAPLSKFRNLLSELCLVEGSRETELSTLLTFRYDTPKGPDNALYDPSICFLASGTKQVTMGNESFVYDSRHFLLSSLHVPTVFQIPTANRDNPCMGIMLKLDMREVAQMMVECELPAPRAQQSSRSMTTGEVTLPLLDAIIRLVSLLSSPEDIPVMAPIIQKEIIYRLLIGDQGLRLRKISSTGSQSHQVAQAIGWLRGNFSKPLRIEELARQVGMSTSTFHSHFRNMTALSPLQYQKQLRLQEARRKMLTDRQDAATAAFEVGYESPSQFSREYSRMFGVPPHRDVSRLRKRAAV